MNERGLRSDQPVFLGRTVTSPMSSEENTAEFNGPFVVGSSGAVLSGPALERLAAASRPSKTEYSSLDRSVPGIDCNILIMLQDLPTT